MIAADHLNQIALDWKRTAFPGLPRTRIRGARESDRKQSQSVFSHAEHALDRRSAKLAIIDATGQVQHQPRAALAALFNPGDLVIANDAATLPASLRGTHCKSGEPVEIRLAAWISARDPTRFVAVAFGAGDHRTRTEERPPPPPLSAGDYLVLGPLMARVERLLDHPRLIALRFAGDHAAILAGLARYGRPIQYAHVPEPLALRDVWTKIAAKPRIRAAIGGIRT